MLYVCHVLFFFIVLLVMVFFFFFQAEDGIRDGHVTGVQTCALPIYREWIDHARKLSTQAREPAPHYEHVEVGFNYRLSNLLAAVGRAQLEVLPERVEARRHVNARYRELLADEPGVTFMPEAPYGRS